MKNFWLFCFFLLFVLSACKKKKESIQVSSNDITESVYASGKIKAVNQYFVYATVNGVLQHTAIQTGDNVLKGQTLFELDNITSALNAENARNTLTLSAENNRKGSDKLQEFELILSLAKERLQMDSSLYGRQNKLWNQNIGTELELEQRKLAYENSLINYKTAKSRLAQLKAQLQNELSRAEVNYSLNTKLKNDFAIKSIVNGRVYDILKEQGELVTPQTPLAVIGNADSFLLELEVDENDILKISIGQKVLVTMDSYKGNTLEAVVDRIDPIMNERTRTFSIEAHFIKPPEKLFPNLTAEANIIIQSKKNTITIPNNYIIDGKFVLVDKNQKREIKIGLKDYIKSEVIEGLKVNETIYKP